MKAQARKLFEHAAQPANTPRRQQSCALAAGVGARRPIRKLEGAASRKPPTMPKRRSLG